LQAEAKAARAISTGGASTGGSTGGDGELARAAFDEAIRVDPARKESLKPLLAKLDERGR